MASITIKGREVPLLYTVYEMKQVQEEICPLADLQYKILGRKRGDETDISGFGGADQLGAIAKLVTILGNAGLEEAGEAPDLTEKKILRSLKPSDLPGALNACMTAMNEGMASEIPPKEEEGPVDVTLEEMEKKKEKES